MAVTQSKTPVGKPIIFGEVLVTLNGSGNNGGQTVAFPAGFFVATPDVMVVKPNGETGTWVASAPSKTQFTLTITGAAKINQDTLVTYVAVEKMG